MSLQYLEALKQIGQSPSTKFVIPMEFTQLLSGSPGSPSAASATARGARRPAFRAGGARPIVGHGRDHGGTGGACPV